MPTTHRLGLLLAVATLPLAAQGGYTITTVAGGAPPPTPMPAIEASIGGVAGVATDTAGNLYFSSLNCVFKVDSAGVMTRVAGTCRMGYSGDGGPATVAQLDNPRDVAVDSAGNLYIADTYNTRVRKVTPAGIITTVAGTGIPGGPIGNGDGGPATSAGFANEFGLTVDSAGNLYIADTYTGRVRKVTPSGIITTVAGTGKAGYSGDGGPATSAMLNWPFGVAVDTAGNLYIADSSNYRVRKVTSDGIITTVAGNGSNGYSGDGGPATSAMLGLTQGVVVDATGNLYIVDSSNSRVRRVSPDGIITTVVGGGLNSPGDGGPGTSVALYFPVAAATDQAGDLYITDSYRLRKVSQDGTITTVAGNGSAGYSGDGGPANDAQLSLPYSVTVDSTGNIYIGDNLNHRVRKVSPGGIITTAAGDGSAGFSGDGGPATSAHLYYPDSVAADAAGNLYIAEWSNHVRKVSPAGIISTVAGNGGSGYSGDGGSATAATLYSPSGLALDTAGSLYVADTSNHRIRTVSPAGIIITVAGTGEHGYSGDGGPAVEAQLNVPEGIAQDAVGNLYIADSNNARVRKVSPSGIITTVAGNGISGYSGDGGPATDARLSSPVGVAVNLAANLYIADGRRVRKVSPAGIITTVAGNGSSGYSGDGGPATSAMLTFPFGLATDALGNVYIADAAAGAVRMLHPPDALPSLSISESHVGDFIQGQKGATYAVTVGNASRAGPTVGTVSVTATLSSGLALVSMSGSGWTCSAGSCICNDVLAPGASYPVITVAVDVSASARSPQVNQVTVSGGGSNPATASDPAVIARRRRGPAR